MHIGRKIPLDFKYGYAAELARLCDFYPTNSWVRHLAEDTLRSSGIRGITFHVEPVRIEQRTQCLRMEFRPGAMSAKGQSRHFDPASLTSGLPRIADVLRTGQHVRNVPILLQKSFGGDERNFLGPLMRFVRRDVRDHIAYQKKDHRASYRPCGALQR